MSLKTTIQRGIGGTLLIFMLAVSTAGCGVIEAETSAQEMTMAKTVKTITTSPEEYVESLDFVGYIFAKDVKNLSFQQGGKIQEIYVEDGQHINAGDRLATLNTTYTNMAVESARQNVSLTQNSIDQLQNSMEQISLEIEAEMINLGKIEDTHKNLLLLYEVGGVSRQEVDDSQNALDLQKIKITNMESQLSNVQKQIDAAALQKNQADIGMQQYTEQINDAILTSPIDGYVISISTQAGEITGAGAPVISIKSEAQIVTIGIPVDDLAKIKTGMPVQMESNGTSFNGIVSVVSQYPDEGSRTYTVEITPDKTDLAIGSIVEVKIPIKTTNVIQVPIKAIINNEGVNYVYCIENDNNNQGKAIMKEVILGEVNGDKVVVQNMEQGVVIVADGVKNIKENDSLIDFRNIERSDNIHGE